jgi:hypothetical protein
MVFCIQVTYDAYGVYFSIMSFFLPNRNYTDSALFALDKGETSVSGCNGASMGFDRRAGPEPLCFVYLGGIHHHRRSRELGVYCTFAGALYATGNGQIRCAVYTTGGAINASLPTGNPWRGNTKSLIMPVLPQDAQDVSRPPLFITNTNTDTIVVSTILESRGLSTMSSVQDAPQLSASVLRLGFTFPKRPNAIGRLPQPDTTVVLEAGDTISGRTYGVGSLNVYN